MIRLIKALFSIFSAKRKVSTINLTLDDTHARQLAHTLRELEREGIIAITDGDRLSAYLTGVILRYVTCGDEAGDRS